VPDLAQPHRNRYFFIKSKACI